MIATKRWMRWLLAAASVLAINAQSAPRPVDDYDDIDVIVAGRYPSASWVAPANNTLYVAPISASNAITLQANAGSRKFTITKLEFVYRKDCVSCSESTLPTPATLQTGNNKSGLYQYIWNNAVAGSYLVRAKATDSGGGISFAGPVTINVDTAPTVAITSPATNTVVTAPASFALTTNAADADAGGSISKVEFFKSATVFDATTRVGTLTAAPWNFTWSNVAAGTYTVVARATDNLGVTTTSAPITLISNAAPAITLSAPTNNATYTAPATVALSATATDSDGTVANVAFYKSATLFDATTLITTVTTGVSGVFSANWAAVPTGSYTVTARATDNKGAIVTSGSANITVCGAPTVTLTSPTAGQQIDVVSGGSTPVTLSATTSTLPASCGTISKIEYYNGTTLVATSSTSPFSTTWNAVAAGNYSIKARAYVGAATTGTDSLPNSLIVNNKPTVTLSQPLTNTFVAAPATISFAATAADVGGTINRVEFLNGATIVNSDTTSPYAYSWTGVTAGVYSLSARAVDNLNATTTSTAATVTVCAAPTVVLNQPTAGQVINLANQTATVTVPLAATPSAPAVGCIGKVEYYNGTTLIATATGSPWSASWTSVAAGSYAIKARAYAIGSTTSYTESAQATLYINKPPVVTLTTPSATQAGLTSPGSITLSATATDTDPNVQSVAFYNGTTLIGTVNTGQAAGTGQPAQSGSVYNYVWTPAIGNYSISAIATDGRTATAQTAANALSVCGAPTITLATSTAQPIVLPANSGVLNATVTQPNTNAKCGTITQVEFFRTGTTLAINTDTTAPYSYTVTGLVAGTTNYTAKVTDSAGRTASTVTSVPLTVVNNIVPTVYISTPATATSITYSPTNAYTVTAKANDTDNGISSIQLRNNAVNLDSTPLVTTDGTACTFTPVTPGLERICSAAIPAGTPVGTQSITAVASDGITSITSAAVVVTIQPAPIVCTLTAAAPLSGTATDVIANCKSGGANLPGVSVVWTGNCANTSTTTDLNGNASCHTNPLSATSNFSINAAMANYVAPSPAAALTVPVTTFALQISSATLVTAAPATIRTIQANFSATTCLSGEVFKVDANGIPVYSGAFVSALQIPVYGAATYNIEAWLTCASPSGSAYSGSTPVTVSAAAFVDTVLDVEDSTATTAVGTVAGTIPGTATVSGSGAASYSMSLPVPPGTAGMQPALSLNYSSQAGRGVLGVGWNLGGLSAIARCPASLAIDQFKGRIAFDANDRYCIDGARLIAVSGSDGVDGTEYRTERDGYSRIFSYGGSSYNPAKWVVQTKAGQINTYDVPLYQSTIDGSSYSMSQIKVWAMSRVQDTVGNYLTIEYATNHQNGWQVPSKISYSANDAASLTPFADVVFTYEASDRDDSAVIYDGANGYGRVPRVLTQIQTQLRTQTTPTIAQTWKFAYDYSPTTRRTVLKSVQLCGSGTDSSDGLCLLPTTFDYNAAKIASAATAWASGGTLTFKPNPSTETIVVGDFNGDGKTEARKQYWEVAQPLSLDAASLALGYWDPAGNCQFSNFNCDFSLYVLPKGTGDFNGDGRTDFVAFLRTSGVPGVSGPVNRYLTCIANSNGIGSTCTIRSTWGSAAQFASLGDLTYGGGPVEPNIVVGDFDGDGLSDVLEIDTGWVFASNGAEYNTGYTTAGQAAGCEGNVYSTYPTIGDFDGDGRLDFARYCKASSPSSNNIFATWTVCRSTLNQTGSTLTGGFTCNQTTGPKRAKYAVHVPDLNGDGLADLMAYYGLNENWDATLATYVATPTQANYDALVALVYQAQWHSCLSKGDGTFDCKVWRGVQSVGVCAPGAQNCNTTQLDSNLTPTEVLGDFNGDGRTDIAVYGGYGTPSANDGKWVVCMALPSGSGVSSLHGKFDCGNSTAAAGVLQGAGDWLGGVRRDNSNAGNAAKYDLVVAGDFDGDGRTDIAGGTPTTSANPPIKLTNVSDPTANVPDMLAKVTNGHGFGTSFTYKPITDGLVYARAASEAVFPQINIQSPIYVVSTMNHDDGLGGQYQNSYFYSGLKGHTQGGGTLGFRSVRVTDAQTSVVTETFYVNDYPQRGLVERTTKKLGTQTLNDSQTTWKAVPYGPTGLSSKIISYLADTTTEMSWDTNGTVMPRTVTTHTYGVAASNEEKYGCATKIVANTYGTGTSASTVEFSKTSVNTYTHTVASGTQSSPGKWWLCRLDTATVNSAQNVYGTASTELRSSKFTYDSTNGILLSEQSEPTGALDAKLTTTYTLDSFGNRKTATITGWNGVASEDRSTTLTYDSNGRFALTTTNAMSQQEIRTYDQKFGNLLTLKGPNLLTTEYKYDKLGRKVVEIRPDSTKTAIVYGTAFASTVLPTRAGATRTLDTLSVTTKTTGGAISRGFADRLGREVLKQIDIDTGANGIKTSNVVTEYDAIGRTVSASRPYFTTDTPVFPGYRTFDGLSRVQNEYLTNDDGTTTTSNTTYDGLKTSVTTTGTNAQNVSTSQSSTTELDGRGKVKKVTDALTNTVEHTYDAAGNLNKTTRTVGAETMVSNVLYDVRGRKKVFSDPDTGNGAITGTTGNWSYDYNAFGEIITQKDAKGQIASSSYDKLGRLNTHTNQTDLITIYTYDTCSMGVGKLCTVTATGTAAPSNGGFSRTFGYDLYGRQSAESTTISGRTYLASTSFDAAGRVRAVTFPNGQIASRGYDSVGNWNLLRNSAGLAVWTGVTADPEGRWISTAMGNGLTGNATFGSKTGRLASVTVSGGVQSLSLGYDGFGNLRSRLDASNGYFSTNASTAESFAYDSLNRLTSVTSVTGNASVSYDGFGRIVTKSGLPTCSTGRTHCYLTGTNRLQSANGKTYSYDANGNVDYAGSATVPISWTNFNQPLAVPTVDGTTTYAYGPSYERRVEIIPAQPGVAGATGATRFMLHSGNALFYEEDIKNDGTTERRSFLSGPGGVVAVIDETVYTSTGQPVVAGQPTSTRYWHRDHLGSITVVTNESGAPLERYRYDAWGKTLVNPSATTRSMTGDRGFTGHEQLVGNLVNMDGRIYDPVLGRFLSADILVQATNDLQAYNRYSYVRNNPLLLTDPTGHIFIIDDIIFLLATYGPYLAAASAAAAGVADATGHFTAAKRFGFAALFFVTAGWGAEATLAINNGGALAFLQTQQFLGAVASGFAMGGVQSGSLEGAIAGAVQAGFSFGVGQFANGMLDGGGSALVWGADGIGRAGMHAVVGCVMAVAGEGKCGRGAAAAGFSTIAGPNLPGKTGEFLNFASALVAGGAASAAAGGSFKNGAFTSAFEYLYNAAMSEDQITREYRANKGHHSSVPLQTAKAFSAVISDEALQWSAKQTVGGDMLKDSKDPANPHAGYRKGHIASNDAIMRATDAFIKDKANGITTTNKMTLAQMQKLDTLIQKLPEVRAFRAQIEMYLLGQRAKSWAAQGGSLPIPPRGR